MEQIILQAGALKSPEGSPVDEQAIGFIALTAAEQAPSKPDRRSTASPETIALLHEAQAGDAEAFAALYSQHYAALSRYAVARLRDHHKDAAPDLIHDAFCDALENISQAPDDVTTWLFQLTAKACTRYHWSHRRYMRAALTVGEATSRVPADQPNTQVPSRLNRISFVHALARLSPNQRRVMQLRYLDGYPRDHAATLMGYTKDSLRHLEYRALGSLRGLLAATALRGSRVELSVSEQQ
jgi:RNA polymerase sigma-70 factor (ECF subfamily)